MSFALKGRWWSQAQVNMVSEVHACINSVCSMHVSSHVQGLMPSVRIILFPERPVSGLA